MHSACALATKRHVVIELDPARLNHAHVGVSSRRDEPARLFNDPVIL